jgi:hypothetical protein
MCTLCGQEANYQLDDLEIGSYGHCSEDAELVAYGDDWAILAENMCEHLANGEWQLCIDGTVRVIDYSYDEVE